MSGESFLSMSILRGKFEQITSSSADTCLPGENRFCPRTKPLWYVQCRHAQQDVASIVYERLLTRYRIAGWDPIFEYDGKT